MEQTAQQLNQAMDDLTALTARTQGFEQKYGLLSADFYALYQAGQLDTGEHLRDVTLWAASYEARLKLEETARQLSHLRLTRLCAAAQGAIRLEPYESAA